jgi:NAD(P)H-nitrite reductase large subunit
MHDSNHDLLICRCEEVAQGEIEAAIDEGASSLNEIKRRTRAGMGLCQGKTCRRLVERILADKTGQKPGDIQTSTHRPPVRPVELQALAATGEE